jgi:hypothetical protein
MDPISSSEWGAVKRGPHGMNKTLQPIIIKLIQVIRSSASDRILVRHYCTVSVVGIGSHFKRAFKQLNEPSAAASCPPSRPIKVTGTFGLPANFSFIRRSLANVTALFRLRIRITNPRTGSRTGLSMGRPLRFVDLVGNSGAPVDRLRAHPLWLTKARAWRSTVSDHPLPSHFAPSSLHELLMRHIPRALSSRPRLPTPRLACGPRTSLLPLAPPPWLPRSAPATRDQPPYSPWLGSDPVSCANPNVVLAR